MGMICSDEVSSINLFCLAERPFLLDDAVRRKYGILYYVRFKDDLLVISTAGPELLAEFLEELQSFSEHFVLKVDASSLYRVEMLDLRLKKGGGLTDSDWSRSGPGSCPN